MTMGGPGACESDTPATSASIETATINWPVVLFATLAVPLRSACRMRPFKCACVILNRRQPASRLQSLSGALLTARLSTEPAALLLNSLLGGRPS